MLKAKGWVVGLAVVVSAFAAVLSRVERMIAAVEGEYD